MYMTLSRWRQRERNDGVVRMRRAASHLWRRGFFFSDKARFPAKDGEFVVVVDGSGWIGDLAAEGWAFAFAELVEAVVGLFLEVKHDALQRGVRWRIDKGKVGRGTYENCIRAEATGGFGEEFASRVQLD